MKKIGCFHAHHSNIELIEQAFDCFDVEWVHFVDPGFDRMKAEPSMTSDILRRKIIETLDWIVKCRVDAVLVTCTYFTAQLRDEDLLAYPILIVKIDEPLFQQICDLSQPLLMLFTNPNTVQGTMDQLLSFSKQRGKEIQAEPVLLEDTFELLMKGRKAEYMKAVTKGIQQLVSERPNQAIVAAQLSMAPAARSVQAERNVFVGNHMDSLSRFLKAKLYYSS
ncbi:hypothetical protein [Paenibacillus beijingensis]|uniref:Asp/Glu/hydantoin racemase n=1 Tax=Paenibacillus beijingensis TaxID=1126833 RepID=A0A0D5NP34_9BACL|nr:hypothetical protein [Paenibacillus beijingensis]AJY77036.1 hypothetical protein VN24_23900 [Paenibacillus beijingensis]